MTEMRDVLLTIVMVAGVATLAACTSYNPGELGCSTDDQCRGDRVCVDRTCVTPLEEAEDGGSGDVDAQSDATTDSSTPTRDLGTDQPDAPSGDR